MAFHIGKLIDKQLRLVGMTKSEFARRIHTAPQNIHIILKKSSIDTDLLQRISKTLGYDFFQHYLGLAPSGNNVLMGNTATELKQELDAIKEEIETISRHNGYLREIVTLMKPPKELMELSKSKPFKHPRPTNNTFKLKSNKAKTSKSVARKNG